MQFLFRLYMNRSQRVKVRVRDHRRMKERSISRHPISWRFMLYLEYGGDKVSILIYYYCYLFLFLLLSSPKPTFFLINNEFGYLYFSKMLSMTLERRNLY